MKTDTKKKEPAFRFRKTDAGRSTSRHPRSRGDCAVRATALVCGVSYDMAYDIVRYTGPFENFPRWITSLAPVQAFGVAFQSHLFPQARYSLARFLEEHPRGRWIVSVWAVRGKNSRPMIGHVFAIIDGVVLDEHRPRAGECVYSGWKSKRAGPREYAQLKALRQLQQQMRAEEKGQDDDDDYAGFDYEERLARW